MSTVDKVFQSTLYSSREVRYQVYTYIIGYNRGRTSLLPEREQYDVIPLTFLNLVVQSAFIPNTKMLSTLLIAKAGLGKTIKLELLRKFPFVYYTVDITPKHLMNFLDKVERGEKRFLVIPDYIATLGHSRKTVDLFRSLTRSLIEEGLTDIDVYGMERHYAKKIKAGLISGITPEYFNENSRIWKSDGFLSRFLPFSYSHSLDSKEMVMQNIRKTIDTSGRFKLVVKTGKRVYEPTIAEELDDKLRLIMYGCGIIEPRDAPYRAYIQFLSLAKSSAVLRESDKVEKIDIDLLQLLSQYFNRKEPAI